MKIGKEIKKEERTCSNNCSVVCGECQTKKIISTENKLTVMQELIEKLHPNFFTEEESSYYLEKEKQQIIEAFNNSSLEGEKMGRIYYETEFK